MLWFYLGRGTGGSVGYPPNMAEEGRVAIVCAGSGCWNEIIIKTKKNNITIFEAILLNLNYSYLN